jgi:hypothetical protein
MELGVANILQDVLRSRDKSKDNHSPCPNHAIEYQEDCASETWAFISSLQLTAMALYQLYAFLEASYHSVLRSSLQ